MFFTRDEESNLRLVSLEDGSPLFLIGSDGLGRDQLSRFLFGGRITLAAGLLAAVLSILGGAIGGTIAGFYGRGVDELVMRIAELFLALPWLYFLFAVRSVLPLSMPQGMTFLLIASIIGVIGWARTARVVRGVVLGARSRGFVLAAKGFGASDGYLIARHVLPQLRSVLLTQASILIPHFVAAEITLSFLGLGVAEPVPSWGSVLVSLRDYYVISYPWVFVPLGAVIPVFYAYMVLATAMQDPVRSETT
jgi:peptide/nickel transport system permease protein